MTPENNTHLTLAASTFLICILPISPEPNLIYFSFEDGFWASYEDFEPCILLTYLFKLCDKTSKALKELKVQAETNSEVSQTRLFLFALARKTLGLGMDVLGITPLDQL